MGANMVSPYKCLQIWVKHFSGYLAYEKLARPLVNLDEGLALTHTRARIRSVSMIVRVNVVLNRTVVDSD